jgi:hypothetical protein
VLDLLLAGSRKNVEVENGFVESARVANTKSGSPSILHVLRLSVSCQ